MAITNLSDYLGAALQVVPLVKTATATTVANQWHTLWDRSGNPGAGSLSIGNTANGVVPTDATTGAPTINAFAGGATGYIGAIDFGNSVASRLMLYDRLFHAGSYAESSGTTNLTTQPSYSGRLPGSSYVGTQIWLEVAVAWTAATASSVTIGYTNQSGTNGRTTGAYVLPTAVIVGRMFQVGLQAGDTGVQRIDSVQLADTTGSPSAGSVNVIVARPLCTVRVRAANDGDVYGPDKLNLPIIYADSCLALAVCPDSTSSGVPEFQVDVINK